MIKFECATLKEVFDCASLIISDGKMCTVLTDTELEKKTILKVVAGLKKPDSGRLFIFGNDLQSAANAELDKTRLRIGVALNDGGLISNLKVWENILLPLSYHGRQTSNSEEKMKIMLDRIGYNDKLDVLPGLLPSHKRRLAGIVRVFLMEPDLIIYDSVLDGLSSEDRDKLLGVINEFHKEKEGRTTVFLASEESSVKGLISDNAFILKQGRFHERN